MPLYPLTGYLPPSSPNCPPRAPQPLYEVCHHSATSAPSSRAPISKTLSLTACDWSLSISLCHPLTLSEVSQGALPPEPPDVWLTLGRGFLGAPRASLTMLRKSSVTGSRPSMGAPQHAHFGVANASTSLVFTGEKNLLKITPSGVVLMWRCVPYWSCSASGIPPSPHPPSGVGRGVCPDCHLGDYQPSAPRLTAVAEQVPTPPDAWDNSIVDDTDSTGSAGTRWV